MKKTMQLTVGPDGRVAVPGARPGQTVTVEISDAFDTPERLTLATARTDEERDQVIAEIKRLAQELREELGEDGVRLAVNHGDWLYDEYGLPT
jgi:hypothetical protein